MTRFLAVLAAVLVTAAVGAMTGLGMPLSLRIDGVTAPVRALAHAFDGTTGDTSSSTGSTAGSTATSGTTSTDTTSTGGAIAAAASTPPSVALTFVDNTSDQVGQGSGQPDGTPDGHFRVAVTASDTVDAITLDTADANGNACCHPPWDTISGDGYWILGVFRDGTELNPNDEAVHDPVSGTVTYDVYADETTGVFSSGQNFIVSVDLANGGTVTATATIPATAPTAFDDTYSVPADGTLSVAAPGVLGNDRGSNLSASLVEGQGPSHGQLQLNADGSFTYTPAAGFSGTDTFQYAAASGDTSSDPANVTITVVPILAFDHTFSVDAGSTLTVNAPGVLANARGASGATLTASVVDGHGASHGDLQLSSDGSFTYTPAAGFSGTDTFEYTASDGEATSDPATITITVAPPHAVADSYSVPAGGTLSVPAPGVLGNDSGGSDLTASLVDGHGASHGDLQLNSDGSFTYTPAAGFSGTDTFEYIANLAVPPSVTAYAANGDAASSDPATVTITVTPPHAADDSYSVGAGDTLNVPAPGVLGNDSGGSDLTASLVDGHGASHGDLQLNSDGSFTYTPAAGFSGTDTFEYTANSNGTSSNPATVTISVAAPTPPSGAVVNLSGCGATSIPGNDDGSAGSALTLPFPLDFFGVTYTQIWVNNNGNVTLGNASNPATPLGTFTPQPIVANGRPIIAPFWADVDTRGTGSGLVSYGTTTYGGHSAVCVLWPHVGYYGGHTDKVNTFQLLLVDRSDTGAGNFDIIFNYGNVRWETGDASGGNGGLGGNSARAGYSNGTTAGSFELPGSAVNNAFLDSNPNGLIHGEQNSGGQLGRYVFAVRSGQAPTGHAISGHVLDGSNSNNPVSGASVTICSAAGCNSTTTHADGSYSYGGLAPGTYVVRATPPAGSNLRPLARQATLGADSDLTGIDLTLAATAPDLHITVEISPAAPAIGENTTITYSLTNSGNADATSVGFSATIPANTHFSGVTLNTTPPPPALRVLAATNPASCSPDAQNATVFCSLGTIASGATDVVTMTVTPTQAGTISSTGSAGSLETQADPQQVTATVGGSSSGGGSGGNTGGNTGGSSTTTTTTSPSPPPPPPPPPITGVPIPPPPPPGSATLQPVSGTVLVDGQPLQNLLTIPFGSIIDATNGIIQITTLGPDGSPQTAYFFGGVFQLLQTTANGVTILKLQNGDFSVCTLKKGHVRHLDARGPKRSKAKHSTKVVRSLWGEGKGSFRTQGRYASATVRGTFWLTADRCDGTLVRVNQGVISLRDLVRKKTIVLHAGQSYLARTP